jgi:MFS family permease
LSQHTGVPPPNRLVDRLGRVPVIGNPAFRIADYRRLWGGAALNHLGMSGEMVILGLLVFRLTGSSAWVGISLALYFLPLLVFGLLSGAIADWMDRRVLLRRVELAIISNLLVFASLLALGLERMWLVLLFTLLSGSLRALHQPLRASYAYDIVGGDRVVAGLGLLSLGGRSGQLVGALLSGWVMEQAGSAVAILVLVFTHSLAYSLFRRLRSQGQAASTRREPLLRTLQGYLLELRGNRTLMMLVLVTAAVEVFGFSFSTALPELATERFGWDAQGLGLLHAARAVGGMITSLTLSALGGHISRRGLAYLGVIFAFGAALLLLAAADQIFLVLAAMLLVAAMAAASDVLTQSMVQLSVENHLRGRAMGAWTLAIGSAPLGHLEMGALAVALGVEGALAANGAALVAVGLITALAVPRLRRL